MDMTSFYQDRKYSQHAKAGLSHINYDEKTEMFEEQFEHNESFDQLMIGASMPDHNRPLAGARILDELYQ